MIHSWSVPSLGIKTDATPGRINRAQGGVFLGAKGVFGRVMRN